MVQVQGVVHEEVFAQVATDLMPRQHAYVVYLLFHEAAFGHLHAGYATIRVDHEHVANGQDGVDGSLVADGKEADSAFFQRVSDNHVHVGLKVSRQCVAAVLIEHAHEVKKRYVACGATDIGIDQPRAIQGRSFADSANARVVHVLPLIEEVGQLGGERAVESAKKQASGVVRHGIGVPCVHHVGGTTQITRDLVDKVAAIGEEPYVLLEGCHFPCVVGPGIQRVGTHQRNRSNHAAIVNGVAVAQQDVVAVVKHHREGPRHGKRRVRKRVGSGRERNGARNLLRAPLGRDQVAHFDEALLVTVLARVAAQPCGQSLYYSIFWHGSIPTLRARGCAVRRGPSRPLRHPNQPWCGPDA